MKFAIILIKFLPELINFIKWIIKEIEEGQEEKEIKKNIKQLNQAFKEKDPQKATKAVNDVFRGI